jgi:hypothetical protein
MIRGGLAEPAVHGALGDLQVFGGLDRREQRHREAVDHDHITSSRPQEHPTACGFTDGPTPRPSTAPRPGVRAIRGAGGTGGGRRIFVRVTLRDSTGCRT